MKAEMMWRLLFEWQNCYVVLCLAPLNVVQSLSDINVVMGQSGVFSFVCDAFPTPKVSW